MTDEILLGNQAIALGLVEHGCRVATAYPGTPSSEILAGVVKFKDQLQRQVYTEWSINEKVAFEVALAASWSGLRASVSMKQVGLNVASDPLFSAAYTGVRAGLLVIPADDPGPHSSQTEQDSRMMALNAKVPVFDPSSPAEARQMVPEAFDLSEQFKLPVMLRPTTRLCHALQSIRRDRPQELHVESDNPRFRKDPVHWTATPKLRYQLHRELSIKLEKIAEQFENSALNYELPGENGSELAVIASGVVFNTARQALQDLGVELPMLKIGTPYPLPRRLIREFIGRFDKVIVFEEPDACIELQIDDRRKILGRLNRFCPVAGELSPEIVAERLGSVLRQLGHPVPVAFDDTELEALIEDLELPVRKPRLCPGCSHRSAFFTIKREFGPRAIYPGDIGCYSLGTNLRTVDTFVDMGASVSMADGFFQATRLVDDPRPIVATIGDSTFLHSGIAALINAVHTGARFILVILDNHTTAMTGFQPTAEANQLADGTSAAAQVAIPELAKACGVSFVEVADPYDQNNFGEILRRAYLHTQDDDGGVAVVIADRPCVLYDPAPLERESIPVVITEQCDGCRYCLEAFECPALVLRPDRSRVDINAEVCVDCGQCIDACYKGFIVPDLSGVQP